MPEPPGSRFPMPPAHHLVPAIYPRAPEKVEVPMKCQSGLPSSVRNRGCPSAFITPLPVKARTGGWWGGWGVGGQGFTALRLARAARLLP